MSGLFEGVDFEVLICVWRGVEADVNEYAVVAVDIGCGEVFAIDGDDAFADFSGRLGDELFEPRAEIGNAGGT